MSKRLQWIGVLAATVLVAAGILALGGFVTTLQPHVQRLPDGTLLSLEAVTYGQEHHVVRGKWWQKILNPLLSNEMRNRLGMMFPGCRSASANALVIWTLRDLPPQAPRRGSLPAWEARGVAFDEAGHGGETAVRVWGAGAFYGAPVLEAWELPASPRRGRRVGLRLYTRPPGGAWVPAAEFKIGNPDPGPHPIWQPHALPITSRQGDVAFILTRFRTGVDETGGPNPPSAVEAWTEATFRITEKGIPTTAWEPADLVISDATGNTWKPPVCLHEWQNGAARLFFRGALWPGEPAWKLRVEFVPAALGSSLWTMRGAAVPPTGVFARSMARTARDGITLRLLGISGEESRAIMPVGVEFSPDTPQVHVRLSPPPNGMRLRLARATDERGRRCALSRPQGGFVGLYSFRLRPPPGAIRLDLSFAVQRQSRYAAFVAAPSAARASQQ